MSAVVIFLRQGEIIVVPQGGGGGDFFDSEPILVVPPIADEVQAAVSASIKVSLASPYVEQRPKGWKSPLLKRFGIRKEKDFNEGAQMCLVLEDKGKLEVERWVPRRDGRGFEQAPEGARPLRNEQELGEAVLKALYWDE
ncbi:MAG: hypothetical protein AB2598_16815 [Candidatus Thiodiazotropha sp.]